MLTIGCIENLRCISKPTALKGKQVIRSKNGVDM